jgi:hypothetical protein
MLRSAHLAVRSDGGVGFHSKSEPHAMRLSTGSWIVRINPEDLFSWLEELRERNSAIFPERNSRFDF